MYTRWKLDDVLKWPLSRLLSERNSLRADIRQWESEPGYDGDYLRQAYEELDYLEHAIKIISERRSS